MNEASHIKELRKLSKQLVIAAEKRGVLKARVAGAKKQGGKSRPAPKKGKAHDQIRNLSERIEDLLNAIARPTPRRVERWVGLMPVTLLVESAGQKFESRASTVDLSSRGLRIRTTTALAPGQTLDVYSTTGRLGRCRVVWAESAGSDRPSEVGLEIID